MGKLHINNKSQVSKAMFLAKYGSLALYNEDLKKRFIIDHERIKFDKTDGWTLIGIPEKNMELCLIMSIFAFMMIYFIEFNKLIKIEISCGGLYQMNQMEMNLRVKQQRYTMTRSKIRRGLLTNIQPSIIFRERGKKQLTIGRIYLMTSG